MCDRVEPIRKQGLTLTQFAECFLLLRYKYIQLNFCCERFCITEMAQQSYSIYTKFRHIWIVSQTKKNPQGYNVNQAKYT